MKFKFKITALLTVLIILSFFSGAFTAYLARQLIQFKNTNDKSFINVIDQSGISQRDNTLGVSWNDYNNDGYQDLLLTGRVVLYKNLGNGTFEDVTESTKLSGSVATAGIFGDYDNDGCPDLYLTVSSASGKNPQQDQLYHNECNETFSNITQ